MQLADKKDTLFLLSVSVCKCGRLGKWDRLSSVNWLLSRISSSSFKNWSIPSSDLHTASTLVGSLKPKTSSPSPQLIVTEIQSLGQGGVCVDKWCWQLFNVFSNIRHLQHHFTHCSSIESLPYSVRIRQVGLASPVVAVWRCGLGCLTILDLGLGLIAPRLFFLLTHLSDPGGSQKRPTSPLEDKQELAYPPPS